MPRYKVVVTKYKFKKPPLMSEDDFKSYKQILSVDSKYDLNPKTEVIFEVKFIKYCLIGMVAGGILSVLWEPLGVIAGFSGVALVLSLIGGVETISSWQRYKSVKRKYFNEIRNAILVSKSYEEFKVRYSNELGKFINL